MVTLIPRARRCAEAESTALERVTAAAFGQRRKMLRSAALKPLGVDPERGRHRPARARGETLNVPEFCALAGPGRGSGGVSGAAAQVRLIAATKSIEADLALAAQPLGGQDRRQPWRRVSSIAD